MKGHNYMTNIEKLLLTIISKKKGSDRLVLGKKRSKSYRSNTNSFKKKFLHFAIGDKFPINRHHCFWVETSQQHCGDKNANEKIPVCHNIQGVLPSKNL